MLSWNFKNAFFILTVVSFALLPMGCKKQPPITLACNAAPPSIYAGDPVTVTATAGSVSTKKNNNNLYNWSGSGATGNGTTATVATSTLDPGSYSVKADVKEGKKGKEGLKPVQAAECTTSFTVKPFEPPTISCAASANTIKSGEATTVTSTATSPQNRPLTYSYSATAGVVSGSGTTAEFSSDGAPTGVVGITCNVSDDKSHSASSNTNVTIPALPPPPPPPYTQALCSISFTTDLKLPTRVDNEAKACLDEVALDMQREADAKAVVVGESNAKERATTEKQEKYAAKRKRAKVEHFADQRAVNAKDYLVTEKGIDASRINVATGTRDGQTVENYLVPSDATFNSDVQGTTPVDELAVNRKFASRSPRGTHTSRSLPSGREAALVIDATIYRVPKLGSNLGPIAAENHALRSN